jgi:hypothetical protein
VAIVGREWGEGMGEGLICAIFLRNANKLRRSGCPSVLPQLGFNFRVRVISLHKVV